MLTEHGWYPQDQAAFDDPSLSLEEAREYLESMAVRGMGSENQVEVDEEQLQNLGYLN